MYTTLGVIGVASVTIVSWILVSDIYSNEPENTYFKENKPEMSVSELEEFLTWAQSEEFINTEWNSDEEMVIDEEIFDLMPTVEEELTKAEIEEKNEEVSWNNEEIELPKEVNLDITFYPQAPDGDWSLPWKEACEESSVVQAYYFVKWKELSKQIFKQEVLSIVETQKDMLWKYIDTSMWETAQFLEAQYGYTDYEIIDNPSVEDLKRELAQWHPIIAPFAGKELWNGFFTNGWPRYHVLVIVGYNEGFFLTNDVGTSRWENFTYSYDTIMNAMHDLVPLWEGDILDGEKRVLVIK